MPKINEVFAFVAEDKGPDDEGVMAARLLRPDGSCEWFPLIGADMKLVESLRPLADDIARATGKPYRILRFKRV